MRARWLRWLHGWAVDICFVSACLGILGAMLLTHLAAGR